MSETTPAPAPKAKKSVALSGTAGRQHRAVHGRPQRQRPALPRLRHPRPGDEVDLRGSRAPAGARRAADRVAAQGLQDQAQAPARAAGDRHRGAGTGAGQRAPDGRAAHRLLGAGHGAAGARRPSGRRGARHRRPADGQLRLDAAVLVAFHPQRPPHRLRDRRRLRSPRTSCTCCTASRRARCTPIRSTSRWCCTPSTSSTPRPSPRA